MCEHGNYSFAITKIGAKSIDKLVLNLVYTNNIPFPPSPNVEKHSNTKTQNTALNTQSNQINNHQNNMAN